MSGKERPSVRRRLAAVAAILCLIGALLSVVFALVRGEAWRLPAALAAGAVAVVALWYAVSRRGGARLLGLVAAPLGVIALLIVVFTADHRGLPLVMAIALILLSGAAAGVALRRDPRTLRSALVHATRASRASHPVLLMNPKSGGGKAERFHLADECRARGIEPIVLQRGDDLLQLAADAIAGGADVIGMAGGDGSQALVATVAAAHDVPHVCVPAGTRNHFALDLGLDRDNVVGALDAFADGVEHRVDLARVNGRVFVNNASMGLYAKIVQSQAYRDAKMKTAADLLPSMLGPQAAPFDLRFTGPDGEPHPSAHLILVSNDPYQLDHLGGRGTRQRMDLGTLGVVAASIADAKEALTFVSLEAAGKIRSFRGWLEWNVPSLRVDSNEPIEIGIDGEALRMDPPLLFESMPGALRVRLPTHAPGYAPAAAAVPLTAPTIVAVFAVAAGRPDPD
ncbi:MAG TPA: diacylglycerol kinase family protein [Actinomycetota bacterium]|jgi:diacylglycerol kinase family enzyme